MKRNQLILGFQPLDYRDLKKQNWKQNIDGIWKIIQKLSDFHGILNVRTVLEHTFYKA